MTFHHICRHFVSSNCEKVAWLVHASPEERPRKLGTKSKNNLREITLGRRPIWGIQSLTLIISWLRLIQY